MEQRTGEIGGVVPVSLCLGSRFDVLLQPLVVDVAGGPLRHLVARQTVDIYIGSKVSPPPTPPTPPGMTAGQPGGRAVHC